MVIFYVRHSATIGLQIGFLGGLFLEKSAILCMFCFRVFECFVAEGTVSLPVILSQTCRQSTCCSELDVAVKHLLLGHSLEQMPCVL